MRFLKFPAFCAAIFLLAGCAGYHLGPVNGETAGARTIQVLPFSNHTLQPRLGDAVTQAVREKLQADGTYHLADDAGDVVISGDIKSYNRQGLSYLNSDVLTASNYRVSIVAHIVARERGSGKVLLDKDLTGYTLVHVDSDLADAERQSLPLLAEDLAERVTEQITEGMW
jgi:hypothetical protein